MTSIYHTDPVDLNPDLGVPIERIEYKDGIKLYLQGHTYPYKGYPNVGAIHAIDAIKRMLRESLRFPLLFLTPRKALRSFNSIIEATLAPHFLKREYMNPMSRELENLLIHLKVPVLTSKAIAFVLECDSAYRLRLQDLLSETDKETLAAKPIRTIKELLALNRQRDSFFVHSKIKKIGWLLILALCWPPFRKTFKQAILQSNFESFQCDEADRYWLSLRTDYQCPTSSTSSL